MRLRQRPGPEKAASVPQDKPAERQPTSRRRLKAAEIKPEVEQRGPRRITIGMGSVVSMLILLLLVAGWGVAASLLLVFGDRMSERLITQSSEMQDAYEQRLQAYRAEVARLTLEIEQSRFDQNSVEGRVVEMGRRQRLIDARLVTLRRLSEMLGGQSGAPPTLAPTPPANRISHDNVTIRIRPLDEDLAPAQEEDAPEPQFHRAQFLGAPQLDQDPDANPGDVERFLERMDKSLASAERVQMTVLQGMRRAYENRVQRIRTGFDLIGLTPEQALNLRGRGQVHLPSIVLPISDEKTAFGEAVGGIRRDFALLHGFRPLIETLPVTRPTDQQVRYSSGFGFRIHPIAGTRRLHAGIDMAAPIGAPIKAAGSGVVLSAGWGGGYGNLVVIDHGGGLVTRYAHLSEILVTPRQPVATGALIGRMGSTGASTGSHLHFETRIGGNPVNPACFILAGDRIVGGQAVPFSCEQPPSWGQSGKNEDEDDDN